MVLHSFLRKKKNSQKFEAKNALKKFSIPNPEKKPLPGSLVVNAGPVPVPNPGWKIFTYFHVTY